MSEEPSGALAVQGLGRVMRVGAHYDYENNASRCGICGGLGMPWGGWFSCEDEPAHVALVGTGECFLVVEFEAANE